MKLVKSKLKIASLIIVFMSSMVFTGLKAYSFECNNEVSNCIMQVLDCPGGILEGIGHARKCVSEPGAICCKDDQCKCCEISLN